MFMFILMMVNRMYRTVAQVRARNAQEASCGRVTGAIDRLMQLLPDFENITGRDLERIASDLNTLRTVFVSTRPAAECLALEAALVESAQAPVRRGDVLGEIRIMQDGKTIGVLPAVAAETVELPGMISALLRIRDRFMLAGRIR